MGELVNLRRFKKQKARDDAAQQAASNRAEHGTTKAERKLKMAREEQSSRQLEGHKIETPSNQPDDS